MDTTVRLIALGQMAMVQADTFAWAMFAVALAFMGFAYLFVKAGRGVTAAICGVSSVAFVIIGFAYLLLL